MQIYHNFLPSFCYYSYSIKSLEAVAIHYFSGKWQFNSDKYNMMKCYDLFVDLNLPYEKRINYPMPDIKHIIPYGSAKYLIGITGIIWQLVPDGYAQYHAGRSSWIINGKKFKKMNHYSDGIELVNDGCGEFPILQINSLVWLLKTQYQSMKLDIEFDSKKEMYMPVHNSRIVGHENIAPGRKRDPGRYFNWLQLENLLDTKSI